METFDLVILGGGAAGLGAARAGRWEGASVALISDAPLGGDCTFTGCVPSKSLIEASRQGLDFDASVARVERVVDRIASTENADVLRSEGVEVIEGRGRMTGPKQIAVDGRALEAKKIILATGSAPAVPPIPGLDTIAFRTNETFFEPRKQPRSLVIVGGGPIGCELGEAMARLGTDVTILEYGRRLLARYEADAAELVTRSLRSLGVTVMLNARTSSIEADGNGGVVLHAGDDVITAAEVLVATGRRSVNDDVGLDRAGVKTDDRGFIQVDDYLRTNVSGVFAAGDCNGVQMLSHAADEMGRLAAWTALRPGRKYRYRPERIPHAVFTTPEVASIGLLEEDAPANAQVAEIEMARNDRALAADAEAGFVRLIARPTRLTRHRLGGKLVGATIVGGRAGEMINEVALMMRMNAYGFRMAQTVRAYPSWSTVMQKAASRWFFEYEGETARAPRRRPE